MPTAKRRKPPTAVIRERERILEFISTRLKAYGERYRANPSGYGLVIEELKIVTNIVKGQKP
ncbi:MAG: hypothetical protein ACYTGV_13915 [Planctomycetota bacterium]